MEIERKARHVKTKLAKAGRQIATQKVGVTHLTMDVELGCESSDLRRQHNKEVITEFRVDSMVVALYVHYLVPRISESHSWLVDESQNFIWDTASMCHDEMVNLSTAPTF